MILGMKYPFECMTGCELYSKAPDFHPQLVFSPTWVRFGGYDQGRRAKGSRKLDERMMRYCVGTIGFSYSDWVGTFYPRGAKGTELLPLYAGAFEGVELDTTFHAMPTVERVAKWADATPAGFLFCPKTPKRIRNEDPMGCAERGWRNFLGRSSR